MICCTYFYCPQGAKYVIEDIGLFIVIQTVSCSGWLSASSINQYIKVNGTISSFQTLWTWVWDESHINSCRQLLLLDIFFHILTCNGRKRTGAINNVKKANSIYSIFASGTAWTVSSGSGNGKQNIGFRPTFVTDYPGKGLLHQYSHNSLQLHSKEIKDFHTHHFFSQWPKFVLNYWAKQKQNWCTKPAF